MALIKTMTVDDFYKPEEARRITAVIDALPHFKQFDFGTELVDFNMVPVDADQLFSKTLNMSVTVIKENSGIFRRPEHFIHFEPFDTLKEWIFVVALDRTIFNIYEHQSGSNNALQGFKFNYRNLFEWNLTVDYQLGPSQGIFFRPWLFHSFTSGLIQVFRLREV